MKGFRDFLPDEKRARDQVMRAITGSFETSGFDPIETPTLEYKETIMGKYGDEADKLVYSFQDRGDRAVALRYDQTVPTARVIAAYQQQLAFPFRRYQTQNVFRADKPQKGRYREFTQCDIDIFGAKGPIADAEILVATYNAYSAIGFKKIVILVNDRAILMTTFSPFASEGCSVFSIIQSIDKLDKMSQADVEAELVSKGLSAVDASSCLQAILNVKPTPELQTILTLATNLGVPEDVLTFSPTTARGLDYYTGMIFEIRIPGYEVGSVGGGGRYDNLVEQLCGVDIPAVGMAFGFDRTVEAAIELGLVSQAKRQGIFVTVFDETLLPDLCGFVSTLRNAGVRSELASVTSELGKQLKTADKRMYASALIYGTDEKAKGIVTIKDLETRESKEVLLKDLSTLV